MVDTSPAAYVQSSKMVHAALLLLMLEAASADLISPSAWKRSTQNLQISTRTPADYPILGPQSVRQRTSAKPHERRWLFLGHARWARKTATFDGTNVGTRRSPH